MSKSKRLLMMIFGAFAIFFTGYPHIWSIYSPYVAEIAGWTDSQASMCFYLALLTFVFGNIIGGRIQDKSNPRLVIFAGGAIQAAGILLSAFCMVKSPLFMYLTYGVLQGVGQGLIYAVILSTAQKWFPDRTGCASGIVVTANGLCGFFLAPLSRKLLGIGGPKMAFFTVGGLMVLAWILSSIFVKVPQAGEVVTAKKSTDTAKSMVKSYTSGEMIRTKKFYLLVLTMTCGLISYFLISPISQTLQIDRGVAQAVAVAAVMAGSLVNAGTRLVLPSLSDKIGRVPCIKAVLIVATIAMTVLALGGSYTTTAAVIVMYGCYGGIMGSFPSFSSSIFGMEHSGENYGFVMSGIVIATMLAPFMKSQIQKMGGSLEVVFLVGIVIAALGAVFMFLLAHELKKDENQAAR